MGDLRVGAVNDVNGTIREARGSTMLLITHDTVAAERSATWIGVMYEPTTMLDVSVQAQIPQLPNEVMDRNQIWLPRYPFQSVIPLMSLV